MQPISKMVEWHKTVLNEIVWKIWTGSNWRGSSLRRLRLSELLWKFRILDGRTFVYIGILTIHRICCRDISWLAEYEYSYMQKVCLREFQSIRWSLHERTIVAEEDLVSRENLKTNTAIKTFRLFWNGWHLSSSASLYTHLLFVQ